MKKDIKIIELFSGIGGFSKGLQDAGFNITEHYFSEIDKHAIANYKYNFPHAKYIGDVKSIQSGDFKGVDVITFGFPCQDLSLAGKRLGFKGKRSSLFYQAVRILRETQTNCFIYENVKGLLSSNNSQDMESVCEELYLSGYIYDFEIQNTKWFIPQNRERIYCIGYNIKYLHKWILNSQDGQIQKYNTFKKIISSWVQMKYQKFLTEVLKRSEQRQKELVLEFYFLKEQKILNGQNLRKRLSEIINSLQLENWKGCYQGVLRLLLKQCDISSDSLTIQKLNLLQEDIKYCGTKEEMERKESFLSIEKLLKMISEENLQETNKCIILTLINSTTQLKTFSYAEMQLNIELFIIQLNLLYPNCWKEALSDLIEKQRDTNYGKIRSDEIKNIKKNNPSSIQLSIFDGIGEDLIGHLAETGRNFFPIFPIENTKGLCNEGEREKPNQIASTLNANDHKSWVGNFIEKPNWKCGYDILAKRDQEYRIGAFRGRNPDNPKARIAGQKTEQMLEISNTLTSVQKDNVVVGTWRTHKDGNGFREIKEGVSPTIPARAREDGSGQPVISSDTSIRRLTEIECERLQGFPDNWTQFGNYDGIIKEIPKTQRYKMLGNAVTVKVVEEIGKRIISN